ncbi:protein MICRORCHIDIA 7 [Lactuca sativa]|uniref:Morc S5 domain-containing protein n=1 Tax=Lactuca sativa TaxID=4236 RepID=A0A9R1WMI8_LACSA|nr:protein MICRORCHIDIA 7 [Lactuca sativa]KAJ0228151.1 hypothetical protein LSAT_V11C100012580 [Lactuca sativa]
MAGVKVKHEILEELNGDDSDNTKTKDVSGAPVIDIDSSDDDSCSSGDGIKNGKRSRVSRGVDEVHSNKKNKSADGVTLPAGFLDRLPPKDAALQNKKGNIVSSERNCKQFWKAGDFEGGSGSSRSSGGGWDAPAGGIDHLRVHPRFLHSNATSHKWVLGAFAELLDNSLDEVCNGATYVKIDMLTNKKDDNRMLLIEDNGGGMDPDKMRLCMSLGFSLKSKIKDAIGQYGNGFKTSTMRLGADVIVFSRCSGKNGNRPTQSIGLLSYTFLRSTGKEDIVVPMLDYERRDREWKKMKRASASDWDKNVEAMVQWSPFSSEADLLKQFDKMKDQGTRIIIYNLWEDDQGQLELDFDADKHDIQIRGVNRDEKSIEMATQYPNSRHFLTYRHSLRSYASILYLRVPPCFRMILRGVDVQHHNIVNDMMMTNEVTYRPQPGLDGVPKDLNMVATVTVGFVKDARAHIDVQGFNVYHKNRLIKPFWRLWNAAGSDGRGVIGVLEANFVEPAHDKQGFERTNVLSRLETRLVHMQKTYWNAYCHKIGYAPRQHKNKPEDLEPSPNYRDDPSSKKKNKIHGVGVGSSESTSPMFQNMRDNDLKTNMTPKHANANGDYYSQRDSSGQKTRLVSALEVRHPDYSPIQKGMQVVTRVPGGVNGNETALSNNDTQRLNQLVEENRELKERLKRREEEVLGNLLQDLESEKNRCKTLEAQIEEEKHKYDVLNREQESIIAIFTEERERRDSEEQTLRKKLKEAEATNKNLVEKVTQLQLEKMKSQGRKWGQ